MKKIILLTALTAGLFTAKAQEIEEFLVLGKDAGTMLQSYLEPAFKGTMYNLNSGWYRTAKPHRVLGFDITLNATLSSVPSSGKNFTFKNSDYENLYIQGTGTDKLSSDPNATVSLPTSFGGTTNSVLEYEGEGEFLGVKETRKFKFNALNGLTDDIGFSQVPAAMIQAGIGLPFKTDVTVRFVPEVGSDKFKSDLIGFGVKHNILQYFPIAKRIPLVDISLFGGYTKLSSTYIPGDDQSIDMEVKTFTGQLLGSVDLKIVNFFVGLGYSKGQSSLNVTGDYSFEYEIDGLPGKQTRTIDEADLPKLKNDINSFMTTAGMSLNLAFFKIYGSYTLQEYNSINAGVSFSFR
ncbi:DUF6588 family protein [Wenyingzhuangia aestuarii]|uniref:DUF6588 family protein n=1 Tax=Wenyingzhuangia aestuarii TaxID=1647582 RepID=UPI00143ADDD4|nr:DUF6588 family protein [Wenyingzhuangia aestuarii]NJB81957.1 hypothetical protein [Wenyingzhuangia aestuarii]